MHHLFGLPRIPRDILLRCGVRHNDTVSLLADDTRLLCVQTHQKHLFAVAVLCGKCGDLCVPCADDVENDFPQYNLICYYESSAGAVVYRSIKGKLRYLLIKNKRSSNWGFPKGHLEMGETKYDAAKREVLEETGLHVSNADGGFVFKEYQNTSSEIMLIKKFQSLLQLPMICEP